MEDRGVKRKHREDAVGEMENGPSTKMTKSFEDEGDDTNGEEIDNLSRLPPEVQAILFDESKADKYLLNMTLNLLVPMYSLLYSLKDELGESGFQLNSITSADESDEMPAEGVARKKRKKKDTSSNSKKSGTKPKPSSTTPKKPRSAYQFFCADLRNQLDSSLPFGELAKEMGRRWKALPEEDRTEYQEKADKDRERFIEEGGTFTQTTTPRKSTTDATKKKGSRVSTAGRIEEAEGSIAIRSKNCEAKALRSLKEAENTHLIDISTKSLEKRWGKFCLSYPHGMIPIPFENQKWAMSVAGVFEGLKVFDKAGVSREVMANTSMKSLVRQERKYGKLLGWSRGLHGDPKDLLNAQEAREQILLPVYKHVLENHLAEEVKDLKELLAKGDKLVLLDENPNIDLEEYQHQLSPALLLKLYLEGQYPS